MSENKIVNMVKFGLKSPGNFTLLANKFFKRFFDASGSISQEKNLAWIKGQYQNHQEVFSRIDPALWNASLEYCATIQKKAQHILSNTNETIGGGGMYPVLYFLTKFKKPSIIVETGVAMGFSSQAFLKAIDENGVGILYSSDLPYFRLEHPEKYIGVVVEENLKKHWQLFTKGDAFNFREIKQLIGDRKIDIFHYDSDKSYAGRNFALNQLESFFAKDAIIIFDDIQDNSHFYDYLQKNHITNYHIFSFEGKYVGIVGI